LSKHEYINALKKGVVWVFDGLLKPALAAFIGMQLDRWWKERKSNRSE
jgi:hypothetical protein